MMTTDTKPQSRKTLIDKINPGAYYLHKHPEKGLGLKINFSASQQTTYPEPLYKLKIVPEVFLPNEKTRETKEDISITESYSYDYNDVETPKSEQELAKTEAEKFAKSLSGYKRLMIVRDGCSVFVGYIGK